jgi:hypothetical protein
MSTICDKNSRVRGSVTNNNGFWIGWFNLLALLLQLQSIVTAHNQWLLKTRSIPYWTTSVFSSTVTDLVLIYESITSSASVVRWLTLHSWTLNSLTTDLRLNLSEPESESYVRPTVSRPVCLGIKHLSGLTTRSLLLSDSCGSCWCGALSLSFTIAAGPRQRSHY